MNIDAFRLVIVMPVYEDRDASRRLFEELHSQFDQNVFLVVVDDGSVRQPVQIENLERAGVNGVVLKLKRNVGHQRAIAIGLGYVSEFLKPNHQIIVMDSDGEDLPAKIPDLLSQLSQEDIDVVVAQRKSRIETLQFKLFYIVYKGLFGAMTGRSISFGNFMALNSAAVKRLVAMQELSIHVASAVLASKLRLTFCPLDRGPRYAGQSKMNFVGLALHGFRGLMVFAEDVLVRVGIVCAIISSLSVVSIFMAIILKLFGYSTPGWFSVALGILVLMLMQTGALALMTLMLTGVVRSGTVATLIAYQDFIENITKTDKVTRRS
jgi:polyisoprenyl-phosphate glycosyltransferase